MNHLKVSCWVLVSSIVFAACIQGGPTEIGDPDVQPSDPNVGPGGPPNVDGDGATLLGCEGSLMVPPGAVDVPMRVDLTAQSPVQVRLPDPAKWFAADPCSVTPHDAAFAKFTNIELRFDRRFPRGGQARDEDLAVVRLDSFEDRTWEAISSALEIDGDTLRFTTDRLGIFAVVRPKDVGLDSLQFMPAYAAILSNFETTAIALLDESGRVLKNSWVDSGTIPPILNGTISGDVYLPTEQPVGQFLWIDRLGVDVVSRFTVPGGELIGQVRAHAKDPGDIAFATNPYDVAFVDARSAWITRYNPGLPPELGGDDPMKRGNDLLEIDPRTMTRTGRTIDMSPMNVLVPKADEVMESVPARPAHVVRVGDFLVVSLSRLGVFGPIGAEVAGIGAIVIVDLVDLSTTVHELPPFKNCVELSRSPDDESLLFVTCNGFSFPFGDAVQDRSSGGIAVVRVDPETGAVTDQRGLTLADHPSMPLIRWTAVALSSNELVASATGDFTGTKDRLYYVDLETFDVEVIAESFAFSLGLPAFDADGALLVVPDADDDLLAPPDASYSTPRIRRFRWNGGDAFEELEPDVVDPALPPRRIYRLSQ